MRRVILKIIPSRYLVLAAEVLAGSASLSLSTALMPVKAAGAMLTNAAGMTLYSFDKDVAYSGDGFNDVWHIAK